MAKSLDSEAHEERERERIAGLEEDIETLRAKLEAAEAALAPLRAVVEACRVFFDSCEYAPNPPADAPDNHLTRFDMGRLMAIKSALPADPSAHTQE